MNSPRNLGRPRDDFRFSVLPSGTHIRLVRILPSRSKDIVSVSLRTVDLDDKPVFTALSYTCRKQRRASEVGLGIAKETFARSLKEKKFKFSLPDGKPIVEYTEPVLCNGMILLVTPALCETLNYFREIESTRDYWIDAICMNQADNEERTSQVKLMGRIYTSAKLVFVWLGSYSRWREGIPGLEKMAQCLTDDELPPLDIMKDYKNYTSLLAGMVNPSSSNHLWHGDRLWSEAILALELTQRLWFTRVWVLQEYLLARRVVFYYAGHQISKEAIRKAFIWVYANTGERRFQRKGLALYSGAFAKMWSSHGLEFPFLLAAREAILQGENLTLVEWIRACRGRQAGDPRDFVFAGLSLLGKDRVWIDRDALQPKHSNGSQPRDESTTLLPRGLWAKLEPLYDATEAEVFINLAACILSERPNQVSGLLSTAARPIHSFDFGPPNFFHPISSTFDGGIPSWAPVLGSWTTRISSDLMTARPEAGGGAATFAAATSGTSPDARSLPQISPDGRTLSLKVISLGTVNREDNHIIDDRADRSHLTAFIEFLLELRNGTTDEGRTSFDGVATCLATCLAPESKPFGATEGLVPSVDEHTLPVDDQLLPVHRPRLWLCELLDREVHDRSRDTQRKISETDSSSEKEDLTIWLADLHSLYLELTARYYGLPWSGKSNDGFDIIPSESLRQSERWKQDGLRADRNSRRGRPTERTAQKSEERGKETRLAMIDWRRRPRVSLEAREYQTAMLREMRFFKKMFVTTDGLVGIGPSWLKVQDRLMLVHGASVPYLFRHVSNADLSKTIQQTKASLERLQEKVAESHDKDQARANQNGQSVAKDSQATLELKKRISGLRAKIREHELQIGKDAWFLVGEVYVDGIMHGEAMTRAGVDAFERISVV